MPGFGKFLLKYIGLLMVVAAAGCQSPSKYPSAEGPAADYNMSLERAPSPSMNVGNGVNMKTAEGRDNVRLAADVDTSKPSTERAVVYTAQLQISVVAVDTSLTAAQKVATDVGGYMENLTSDRITLRVPSKSFFAVAEKLQTLGQTLNKEIQAEDVTDQYVDLQLRLRNAEALRDRFQAILEKAQTIKETLEIERELNRVREDIERIKGTLAVLEKRIAMSTITVNFVRATTPVAQQYRAASPFPWLDTLGVETVLQMSRRDERGGR